MKTLEQIQHDSTKSILERSMAECRRIYRSKKKAISAHATRHGIDIEESSEYYEFVSASKYE